MNKINVLNLSVCVKPNSRREFIEYSLLTNVITIRVNAPPVDQKANFRVIELLAKTLGLPKSALTITKGFGFKLKSVEVQTLLTFDQILELINKNKP